MGELAEAIGGRRFGSIAALAVEAAAGGRYAVDNAQWSSPG